MKLKIHPILKEPFVFIFLWTETARRIYSGRVPDGPPEQSETAASPLWCSLQNIQETDVM